MANNCIYEMKIKGTKRDCQEWLSRMKNYDDENHFRRIFSAEVKDEYGADTDYEMTIRGDCAWSLESCCRASGYSKGIDLFEVNSKQLNIIMEAWSTEPGIGFQEHYLYVKGECKISQCTDYYECWYNEDEYDSFEDFVNEYDLEGITVSDLDERNCYCTGGFDDYGQYVDDLDVLDI